MTTAFTVQAEKALEHLRHELQTIRTGRANPSVVEHVPVEAYGTKTPLVQLATINAPEPRLVTVQPWDPSLIKEIEKALSQSSLGISPVVDGKTIRLPFPAMTEERRLALTKTVNEMGEEARIRLRAIREEHVKELRMAEKSGDKSEDIVALELKKLQDQVDAALKEVAHIVEKKTEELTVI